MSGTSKGQAIGGLAVVALWAGVCGMVPSGTVARETGVPELAALYGSSGAYGGAAPAVAAAPGTDGGTVPLPGPDARLIGPVPVTDARPDARAETAVRFALAQIGLPYVWGGNGPAAGHAGFDCSGLTTAAYAAAGLGLPRTAHTQFQAGPHLMPGATMQRGDLVFYGTPERVHHVGMYIGGGMMVNAPTFGQPVQVARVRWAGDDFVGAGRPAASGAIGTSLLPVPPMSGGTPAPGGVFPAPAVPAPQAAAVTGLPVSAFPPPPAAPTAGAPPVPAPVPAPAPPTAPRPAPPVTLPRAPVPPPVTPPVTGPTTPPVTPPVTRPTTPPVTRPTTPPVTPPTTPPTTTRPPVTVPQSGSAPASVPAVPSSPSPTSAPALTAPALTASVRIAPPAAPTP